MNRRLFTVARGVIGLEVGDEVYISEHGLLRKRKPGSDKTVFGYVTRIEYNLSNGNSEIDIGGIG